MWKIIIRINYNLKPLIDQWYCQLNEVIFWSVIGWNGIFRLSKNENPNVNWMDFFSNCFEQLSIHKQNWIDSIFAEHAPGVFVNAFMNGSSSNTVEKKF